MKNKQLRIAVILLGVLNVFQGVQLFRILENYKEVEMWRMVFSIAGFSIILLFSIFVFYRIRKLSRK